VSADSPLARQVAARSWYHTIELAPGLTTPGWFDTRPAVGLVPLPGDLSGLRCLDVGTFDGFWAFEMERRGAAEVVAVDVVDPAEWDWPAGTEDAARREISARYGGGGGFELAARVLVSRVQRVTCNVYDLDPGRLGDFDVVYVGSLLLHLRDPVRAVEAVRSVCRGSAVFVDAVDPELSLLLRRRAVATFDGLGRPWWWRPNAAALARLVTSGGFRVVEGPRRFAMPSGAGQSVPRPRLRALRTPAGRLAWTTWRRGDPHAALRAE
jgi:tRNA (mo5U34)-methyltransferase